MIEHDRGSHSHAGPAQPCSYRGATERAVTFHVRSRGGRGEIRHDHRGCGRPRWQCARSGRTTVGVRIADEGRPTVLSAYGILQDIYVTFSEPMLKIGEGGGVTMVGNYKLNGKVMPAGAEPVCISAGCGWVRIYLPEGTLTYGASYTVAVASVVDRAGLNIAPDPTTITFLARDR